MHRSAIALLTADDLERLELPGKTTELVRGRLVVHEPPGTYRGALAGRLTYLIGAFVFPNDLGIVAGQDTGFRIASDPDTVRAADVAFLSKERASRIPLRGYARVAPDLAIEIVSADDRPGELLAKAGDWLAAGVRLVWVLDPPRSEARVYRADGSVTIVGADGELDGETVLAGFRCRMTQVLG